MSALIQSPGGKSPNASVLPSLSLYMFFCVCVSLSPSSYPATGDCWLLYRKERDTWNRIISMPNINSSSRWLFFLLFGLHSRLGVGGRQDMRRLPSRRHSFRCTALIMGGSWGRDGERNADIWERERDQGTAVPYIYIIWNIMEIKEKEEAKKCPKRWPMSDGSTGDGKERKKKRSERRTRSKKLLNRQVEQIQLGSGPKFDRSLIVVRRDPVCLGIPSGHLHAPLTYGSTHTLHVLGGRPYRSIRILQPLPYYLLAAPQPAV